jgi:ribose transport system permease protein
VKELLRKPAARALGALILVMILGAIFNANGTFFQWATHRDLFRQIAVTGILACGMTLVIITSGIDLSVGSLLGLSSVCFSIFMLHWGWSAWSAVPLTIGIGMLCGLASGSLIGIFRLQPFIATLAMMVFARGLAKYVSAGQKISRAIPSADGSYQYVDLPQFFDFVDHKILGGNLAVVTVIFLICVAICGLLLAKLRWGRYLYATGGNEEAARLSGVPTTRVKLSVYALSGLFCAIAGICQAVQEQQGDPESGAGYELSAIAIVVIGGTSLSGGRGGIALTLLGAVTIGYLEKILSINAVDESSRLMLTGAIIVAAVLLQKVKKT